MVKGGIQRGKHQAFSGKSLRRSNKFLKKKAGENIRERQWPKGTRGTECGGVAVSFFVAGLQGFSDIGRCAKDRAQCAGTGRSARRTAEKLHYI